MPFFYSAYGWLIESQLELPGFYPVDAGEPDVCIRIGKLAPFRQELGLKGRCWANVDGEVTIRVDNLGTFGLRRGCEVIVHPDPGVFEINLVPFLKKPVLSSLLVIRRGFPLQGSAIETPHGAVIFAGATGLGKSTLAAAFNARGFPLLCDDVVGFCLVDGRAMVLPSFPYYQLWGESLPLLGYKSPGLSRVRPGIGQYVVAASDWKPEPKPVLAIYYLTRGSDITEGVRQLDGQEALMFSLLCGYHRILAYQLNLTTPQTELCLFLAENLKQFNMIVSHSPTGLDTLCNWVAQTLPKEPAIFASPLRNLSPDPPPSESPPPSPRKAGFVWLASYPKSGNTWVRALLTAWGDSSQDVPDLSRLEAGSRMNTRLFFEEELGLSSELLNWEEQLVYRSRLHDDQAAFLGEDTPTKIHDVRTVTRDGQLLFPDQATAGTIYIIRCPLDVAVSFSHHYRIQIGEMAALLAAKNFVLHGVPEGVRDNLPQRIGSWSEHVLSWTQAAARRLLIVRYEDLKADTLKEFQRIIEFLGEPWEAARGRLAVQNSKFDKLQQQEQERGFVERPQDGSLFFRKGKVGDWREFLPTQVARQISLDHGPVMRLFGYGAEANQALELTTRPGNIAIPEESE